MKIDLIINEQMNKELFIYLLDMIHLRKNNITFNQLKCLTTSDLTDITIEALELHLEALQQQHFIHIKGDNNLQLSYIGECFMRQQRKKYDVLF